MNCIYNASDVNLTTTQGEGWGLPITEAMAAKTINLAPAITSIPELFNIEPYSTPEVEAALTSGVELRGIPLKSGSTTSEWVNHGAADLERFRPLTNIDDAVQKLIWVYDHPDEAKTIATRAYKWIQTLPWSTIADRWDELFTQAFVKLETERSHPGKQMKHWSSVRVPSRPLK